MENVVAELSVVGLRVSTTVAAEIRANTPRFTVDPIIPEQVSRERAMAVTTTVAPTDIAADTTEPVMARTTTAEVITKMGTTAAAAAATTPDAATTEPEVTTTMPSSHRTHLPLHPQD